MKYRSWIIVLVIIGIVLGIGAYLVVYNVGDKSNNQENYEATRTEAEVNNADNQNINQEENNTQTEKDKEQETQQQSEQTQVPVEKEIASFSTKIVTKDSSRQNNIRITCNTLNETIVEPGATFSFCNTVGQATTAKGYQKADIFDANGKKKKGLGGGNCQISTTLYNAVLSVPSLKVTERHPHSNKVPYIQTGKDAAVAFGSYDLKFVNNSGYKIKILASTSGADVTIKLISIS
ncbi:MAG: VanW family protein [Clostridia bacterium]|nr:VanW family protein [Clostridia bacterium]